MRRSSGRSPTPCANGDIIFLEVCLQFEHIYQHSLKNWLKQVIQIPEQQYFLTKLLGYSYNIVYHKGRENLAADALSRILAEEDDLGSPQLLALLCEQLPDWLKQLLEENRTDDWLDHIQQQIKEKIAPKGFSISNGMVMFTHRYCLA